MTNSKSQLHLYLLHLTHKHSTETRNETRGKMTELGTLQPFTESSSTLLQYHRPLSLCQLFLKLLLLKYYVCGLSMSSHFAESENIAEPDLRLTLSPDWL